MVFETKTLVHKPFPPPLPPWPPNSLNTMEDRKGDNSQLEQSLVSVTLPTLSLPLKLEDLKAESSRLPPRSLKVDLPMV